MRVILDLSPSASDHVVGTVSCDQFAAPMPFEGWLDLMRLLETITTEPDPRSPLDRTPHKPEERTRDQ